MTIKQRLKKIILILFYPLIILINALHFLTILPLPKVPYYPLNKIMIAIPFAGIVLGFLVASIYQLCYWLGLPAFICAVMAVLTQIIVTGGLHEDGLADMCDALGVRHNDPAEKLQIIRDGHMIGTYGALALIMSVLAKIMFYTAIIQPEILWVLLPLTHMLSRTQWVVLVYLLPIIKGSKLAKNVQHVSQFQLFGSLFVALMFAYGLFEYFFTLNIQWELILLFWLLQIYGIYWFFKRKFGGFSGDLLGASQQITEILLIFVTICMIFLAK